MEKIVIGVDPHKLSATIEVVDHHERVLASKRIYGNNWCKNTYRIFFFNLWKYTRY